MALKTGYKVNGKEIILDDLEGYTAPTGVTKDSIKTTCNKTLSDYKVEGQEINASKYVEQNGQILADLPGDNYYKAPSGAPKFALYGTNTVGGNVEDSGSEFWEKYTGNDVGGGDKEIFLMYNGTQLGEAEQDSIGVSYNIKRTIRTYEYNPSEIKLWCMMVSSGGGGGYSTSTETWRGGGGGGAAAYVCLRLKAHEMLHIRIPPAFAVNEGHKVVDSTILNTLDVSIKRGTFVSSKSDNVLRLTSGEAGPVKGFNFNEGGKGGTLSSYNYTTGVFRIGYKDGSAGGGCNIIDDESNSRGRSNHHTLFADIDADYYPLGWAVNNLGGFAPYMVSTGRMGGGGASAFPGGFGGFITESITYTKPEPGRGGGGGAIWNTSPTDSGYSSSGAFWLLYA